MSEELHTPPLPVTHVFVGYCWSYSRFTSHAILLTWAEQWHAELALVLAAIRCPRARELHTTIRFVSGIEAANSAEPDGNQVNANAGVDTSIGVRLRQRFQATSPSLASLHRGGLKVPPNGTAFAVQSMRRVSHVKL